MNHCTLIGIDTEKHSFALHGADANGAVCFSKTLGRNKVLAFLQQQPPCMVALECCGGSHYWARAIQQLGHKVKLLPAAYVKPYVKRQKNDVNDAMAIAEAASRASIRGVNTESSVTNAAQTPLSVIPRAKMEASGANRNRQPKYIFPKLNRSERI